MDKIVEFYNNLNSKFLTDFAFGNPRLVAAIEFVLKEISGECGRILDIGCGIGWSSYEMARNYKSFQVDAIDLSPASVSTALKLFKLPNLSYSNLDLDSSTFLDSEVKYDIVVMIDVLEHISTEKRVVFFNRLKNKLNDNASLVMTFPSPENQNWLKENDPSKLQPIDETISLNEIIYIASQLDFLVRDFHYISIWHSNDYIHAVLCKKIKFINKPPSSAKQILTFREREVLLRESYLTDFVDWNFVKNILRQDKNKSNRTRTYLKNFYKRLKFHEDSNNIS